MCPYQEWRGASKSAIVLKAIPDLNFVSSQVRGGFFEMQGSSGPREGDFCAPEIKRKEKAKKGGEMCEPGEKCCFPTDLARGG
jgi:hypothetical protein